jgi:hypothetical protein
MKFLADENVEGLVIQALRAAGHDVAEIGADAFGTVTVTCSPGRSKSAESWSRMTRTSPSLRFFSGRRPAALS